jgi:hypothetical protein
MTAMTSLQTLPVSQLLPLDDELSKRDLTLDPAGYFIIYLDVENQLICAKHFSVFINDKGIACDPVTGNPLPAKQKLDRPASSLFTAKTAKALSIEVFEQAGFATVSLFDHAAYCGREFMRAEMCLRLGLPYVQD